MLNVDVYKEQRICMLVDVQNMYYSAKNLYNCKVNFIELLKTALHGRKLIRAIAYVIKADVKDEPVFHEALEKIGFEVKIKDLLVFHGGHKKGDWDIGIAMDAVRAAEKVDTIVVVSGDGDFRELYEYVRGKGCRIEVLAFGKTASSSIKDYVDDFVDLDKNKKYLIPLKPSSRNSSSRNSSSKNLSSKSYAKDSRSSDSSKNSQSGSSLKSSSSSSSSSGSSSSRKAYQKSSSKQSKQTSGDSNQVTFNTVIRANMEQPGAPDLNVKAKTVIPNPTNDSKK